MVRSVPIAITTSPALSTVSAGGWGWKLPSAKRTPTMIAPPRTSAIGWPSPAQPGADLDLLHAVLGRDVDHAGDLRVQREARHLRAAGLVGRDDARRPGAQELGLRVLGGRARHDRDVGAQLARGQRDEDVVGVGVHAGDDPARAHDPRGAQDLVLGRLALDEAHADPGGQLAVLGQRVDDDVARPGRAQVARDLAAHAPEAADDVVVAGGFDGLEGPALGEQVGEMAGDEDLRHRHQAVEERTDAQHDEQGLDHLAGDGLGVGVRADGGDRVERPLEGLPDPAVLGQREPDRARRDDERDHQRELAQAPQEGPDLGALAHQWW